MLYNVTIGASIVELTAIIVIRSIVMVSTNFSCFVYCVLHCNLPFRVLFFRYTYMCVSFFFSAFVMLSGWHFIGGALTSLCIFSCWHISIFKHFNSHCFWIALIGRSKVCRVLKNAKICWAYSINFVVVVVDLFFGFVRRRGRNAHEKITFNQIGVLKLRPELLIFVSCYRDI